MKLTILTRKESFLRIDALAPMAARATPGEWKFGHRLLAAGLETPISFHLLLGDRIHLNRHRFLLLHVIEQRLLGRDRCGTLVYQIGMLRAGAQDLFERRRIGRLTECGRQFRALLLCTKFRRRHRHDRIGRRTRTGGGAGQGNRTVGTLEEKRERKRHRNSGEIYEEWSQTLLNLIQCVLCSPDHAVISFDGLFFGCFSLNTCYWHIDAIDSDTANICRSRECQSFDSFTAVRVRFSTDQAGLSQTFDGRLLLGTLSQLGALAGIEWGRTCSQTYARPTATELRNETVASERGDGSCELVQKSGRRDGRGGDGE